MFYITQSGQIYSGDPQNDDRQLTEEETNFYFVKVTVFAGFSDIAASASLTKAEIEASHAVLS